MHTKNINVKKFRPMFYMLHYHYKLYLYFIKCGVLTCKSVLPESPQCSRNCVWDQASAKLSKWHHMFQVWQLGSSRHCYAEEVPGIVEEVQTGQVNISKKICSWKQQADQNLLDQVMKANVGMSGRKKISSLACLDGKSFWRATGYRSAMMSCN